MHVGPLFMGIFDTVFTNLISLDCGCCWVPFQSKFLELNSKNGLDLIDRELGTLQENSKLQIQRRISINMRWMEKKGIIP